MLFFLVLLSISQSVNVWLKSNNPHEFKKVWVDWERGSKFSELNALMHFYGARLRTQSNLLNSSSYFTPPAPILKVMKIAQKSVKIQEIPVMKAEIDGREIYKVDQFNYGDAKSSLDMVKIPEVHKKGFIGTGVKIALLDVGVDSTHPAVQHIWLRGGIVAKHDFNSGDHLFLNGLSSEIPLIHHGVTQYINSYSVTSDSNDIYIVYSISPTDSLALSYLYGKWTLGLTVGELSEGRIVSWDTLTLGNYEPSRTLPDVSVRNDSLFIVWQEYDGDYRVKFAVYDSLTGLSTPISVSSNGAMCPKILSGASIIYVSYYESSTGYVLIAFSTDGGGSFNVLDTLFNIGEYVSGYDAKIVNDSLFVAYSNNDSTFIAGVTSNGVFSSTVLKGTMPALSISGEYVSLALHDGDSVEFIQLTRTLSVTNVIGTIETPFVYKFYIDGHNLYVSDGKYNVYDVLNGNLAEIDSEFVDYVDGNNGFVVYRKRGDSDISPDPYDPTRHGTKMLSIIGGFMEGSIVGGAPGADYLIAKTEKVVTGPTGGAFESVVEEDFWVEAMEWSIRHGANILSSSLGYRYAQGWDWYGDSRMNGEFAHSSRAAGKASQYNLIVVTAMGNVGHSLLPNPVIGDTSLDAPADAKNIVSVGGVVSPDSIEPNCGFGPTSDGRIKPEVVAPYRISWPDTDGTIYIIGGTSIATAIVAGGLGAVLEAHPSWDAAKTISLIKQTASKIANLPDSNNISGYGLFNAYNLLMCEPLEKQPPGEEDRILKIYPNPLKTRDVLNIDYLSFHKTLVVLRIYTLDGRLVKKQLLGASGIGENYYQVQLLNLPAGTYILLLKTGFSTTKALFSISK